MRGVSALEVLDDKDEVLEVFGQLYLD